jgi:hypothetical protein
MAKTQLTTELLRQFAQLLTDKRESFEQIKETMDNALRSFLWDDPVAHKFKADYEERMQPLKTKLLPAMVKYEDYLKKLSGLSDVYTENNSPSSMDFNTVAATAVVGGATVVAGVVATGSYRGIDYSNAFREVDLSAKKWGSKTKQQKIDELQKLENNIAKIQNRTAATIKEKSYSNNKDMGDYDKANNTININKKLLEGDYDYDKLKKVVNTTAHEGRHDCQYEASMTSNLNAVCGTTDERKEWKKEFSDMTNQYAKEGKILKKCNFEYTDKGEIDWKKSQIKIFNDEMHISGSACDWKDYRYGNKIEADAWGFGDWFEKQFEQKFPEKPRRIKR